MNTKISTIFIYLEVGPNDSDELDHSDNEGSKSDGSKVVSESSPD